MQTYTGHIDLPESGRGAVIAIGNFDGVHKGHRVVIDQVRQLAETLDAPLAVALFQPHPRSFFAPGARSFRLMSKNRRNETLAKLGVSRVYELAFDADMARMSPETFVDRVLHKGLGVRGIVTGEDFRFGADRAGAISDLEALGQARGIETAFAPLKGNGADKISSTRIRKAIHDGDMMAARELLGQSWSVEGVVIKGDQRGRTIGFPTANLDMADFARPAYGVYAVQISIEGENDKRPGVANIGKRPTVDGETELLEIHLLEFDGDLYGQSLSVEFHAYLRAEQRFDGLDALKAQIQKDVQSARRVLSAVTGPA